MRRFPKFNVTVEVRSGSNDCPTNHAGAYAAEAYYRSTVHAFIGPACSFALDSVGR